MRRGRVALSCTVFGSATCSSRGNPVMRHRDDFPLRWGFFLVPTRSRPGRPALARERRWACGHGVKSTTSHFGHSKDSIIITVTSVEAQSRFGELIDRSQREPIEMTRRGRVVAYVVSGHDMRELADVRQRREEAAQWFADYRRQVAALPVADAPALSDADVDALVHELR